MKEYITSKIKNIAIVGHSSSGKTTLAEAILFSNKASERLGTVADGTTVCDYEPEEIRRKSSISLSLAPFIYNDTKINLLDTPGLFDFTTGLYEGISACDSVLLTVSGKSGITVGAKKAYKLAKKQGKARMIFVSKLDRDSADFYKVLEQLKSVFGPSVFPLVVPFGADKKIEGYINLIELKAYKYENGIATEIKMPESEHRIDGLMTAISEAVAETDEALFEKYFAGEQFTREELIKGIHNGIKNGSITPVFCGSGLTCDGVDMLVDAMANLLPSPDEIITNNVLQGEVVCDASKKTVAYIFKTVADPFVGKMSYVKVLQGVLKVGTDVKITNKETPVKIGKLMYLCGKKQEDTAVISAGDIGVVAKLDAKTGDTIFVADEIVIEKPNFPIPCYSMAIVPTSKGDETKISSSIARLLDEDASLSFEINKETHQQIISGLGEQHLESVVAKLSAKFGVNVKLEAPIVAYRETIMKKVVVEGKHKKQSGGHGQFGHVFIEFDKCDSEDLLFETRVVGGSVPKSYFPAVEKGLRDCILHGILAGYPVVNLKATLTDGSYHDVDSSEMAFKMAAALAYKDGMQQAAPVLLEPIGKLSVIVPDSNTGDMMGELNKRRGRVLGMTPDEEGTASIQAEVPMSEMHDFATLVRQMTQGSGSFIYEFVRYEQLPNQLVAGVIEKAHALQA